MDRLNNNQEDICKLAKAFKSKHKHSFIYDNIAKAVACGDVYAEKEQQNERKPAENIRFQQSIIKV